MSNCCLCGREDAEHVIERKIDGKHHRFAVHVICAQLVEFEHDAEFKQQELAWKAYKKLDQVWITDRPPPLAGNYWLRVDDAFAPTVLEVSCRGRELQVFECDMSSGDMRMKWMPLEEFWDEVYSWQAVMPWSKDPAVVE